MCIEKGKMISVRGGMVKSIMSEELIVQIYWMSVYDKRTGSSYAMAVILKILLRFITKGSVDKSILGPDRLAGPKALNPNYCK